MCDLRTFLFDSGDSHLLELGSWNPASKDIRGYTECVWSCAGYQGVPFSRHSQSSKGNNDNTERKHEKLWEPK